MAKQLNRGQFPYTPVSSIPSWYLAALLSDHADDGVKWGELDQEQRDEIQAEARARAIAAGNPPEPATVVEEAPVVEDELPAVEVEDTVTDTADTAETDPPVVDPVVEPPDPFVPDAPPTDVPPTE